MSKRKNRKQRSKPNLPEETLARARRQAGLEEEPEVVESEAESENQAEASVAEEAAPIAARRDSLPPIERRSRSRRKSKPEELTHDEIAERLANPTREVSQEELQAQYTYVTADLRSMGLLAALLFITMIVAARFL